MRIVFCITEDGDQHTSSVLGYLNELDAEAFVLDRAKYGQEWNITAWCNRDGAQVVIQTRDKDILVDSNCAIYNRRDFTVASQDVGGEHDIGVKKYVAEQRAIHVNSIIHELSSRCRMMNSPAANRGAQSKIRQLSIAAAVGLEIPTTYLGGSPEIADSFQSAVDGRLIVKPLEGLHLHADSGVFAHYTEEFDRRSASDLESLSLCPVIIQEFVPKQYELRVTVVGEEIFACGIDTSNASPSARIDWRHYDLPNTPHFRAEVPVSLENKLRTMMGGLGISYGAFDLVLSPDDRYVFLEVNSMGQWLWIEDLTELPISRSVAAWLASDD